MQEAIHHIDPDIILLHMGTTSFLYQEWKTIFKAQERIAIAIFTSPVYAFRDLARLGIYRLSRGYRLSAVPLLGSLIPGSLLNRQIEKTGLHSLVVQTNHTRKMLISKGLLNIPIEVIPPGIDAEWYQNDPVSQAVCRAALGFSPEDTVFGYFGSLASLRGAETLLKAFSIAQPTRNQFKLVFLSRRRGMRPNREEIELEKAIARRGLHGPVKIVPGFLDRGKVRRMVKACDIVALPFEMVPSDAPLSLLEAKALGKPLVTTESACLPELAQGSRFYLAQPADPSSLAIQLRKAANDLQSGRGRDPTCNEARAPIRSWPDVGSEWSRLIQSL